MPHTLTHAEEGWRGVLSVRVCACVRVGRGVRRTISPGCFIRRRPRLNLSFLHNAKKAAHGKITLTVNEQKPPVVRTKFNK